MPSQKSTTKEDENTEVEGPMLLASTHIDFSELEESSTEHVLILDVSQETDTRTTNNTINDAEFNQTTEQHIVSSKVITRHKSISDNLFSTSTISYDTSLYQNEDGDGFQTEAYEITDLFPNINNNTRHILSDDSGDRTDQEKGGR